MYGYKSNPLECLILTLLQKEQVQLDYLFTLIHREHVGINF